MADLITTPNLTGHDEVYQALVDLHDGLDTQESLKVWSRLTLLLVNHLGDRQAVAQAIALARPGGRPR